MKRNCRLKRKECRKEIKLLELLSSKQDNQHQSDMMILKLRENLIEHLKEGDNDAHEEEYSIFEARS